VDAPHDTSFRHGGIALGEAQRMPDGLFELVEAIPLEEDSPIIAELLRGNLITVWHSKFANLHAGKSTKTSQGPGGC
jgi:hypothetical protein